MNTQEQAEDFKSDMRCGRYGEPLMRRFIHAEIKTKKDSKTKEPFRWIYWYWVPESTEGNYDCGFSGIREDNEDFERLCDELL